MKSWAIQDAKDQFSHVLELARTVGPQTITKHGKPAAVVIAPDEFKRLTTPQETPLEFFSRLKGLNLEIKRRKELPRKIRLG